MKRKKERAAQAQREKRTANSSTILAEKHRIPQRKRLVAAKTLDPQNHSAGRRAQLALAASPICFRPFCTRPTQARNKAPFQMIESRNSHRSWSATRRSPSSKTKSPVSKAPASTLRCLFSGGSRKQKYSALRETARKI
jgi:hypothetical protein